jgi:hypothetical protein
MDDMHDADYAPDASALPMQMASAPMLPPNADDIVIKNHFPVARIKRIMQADDDVGKVAQVTPVVVCMHSPCLWHAATMYYIMLY